MPLIHKRTRLDAQQTAGAELERAIESGAVGFIEAPVLG